MSSSEQDIRDRAREIIQREIVGTRIAVNKHGAVRDALINGNDSIRVTRFVLAALESAGIALMDAGFECVSRGYTDHVETRMRNDAATLAERDAEIAALVAFSEYVKWLWDAEQLLWSPSDEDVMAKEEQLFDAVQPIIERVRSVAQKQEAE